MCTALSFHGKDHYFGRTLDLHCSYGEKVCVTPRNFPFSFRKMGQMSSHYALIGMAMVAGAEPLYYDAVNEKGLCMAGLNFPGNAHYFPEAEGKDNVTPFEFIPWILGQCRTVQEAAGTAREEKSERRRGGSDSQTTMCEWFNPTNPTNPINPINPINPTHSITDKTLV